MKQQWWSSFVGLALVVGCGGPDETNTTTDEVRAARFAQADIDEKFPVGINVDSFREDGAACLLTLDDEIICAVPSNDPLNPTVLVGRAARQLAGTMSLAARYEYSSYGDFQGAVNGLGEDYYADRLADLTYGPQPQTAFAASSGPGRWERIRRALRRLFRRRKETRDPPSRPPPRPRRPWPDAEDCRLRSQDALENCEAVILTPIRDSDGNIVAHYDQLGRIH